MSFYFNDSDEIWVSPPGETILDVLEEKGVSTGWLADELASSEEFVSLLIAGDVPIDEGLAEELESVLGGSKDFWLNRDKRYRQDKLRKDVQDIREAVEHLISALRLIGSRVNEDGVRRKVLAAQVALNGESE